MTELAVDSLLVLLVEDSPTDARLVEANLHDATGGRARIAHATRLAEVLPILATEEPACALLDLGLPDAVGFEAVEHFVDWAPHVPLIVLTGRDDDELGVAAVNLGAQDYLTKADVGPRTLLRAIRYAIERSSYTEALRQSEEAYRLLFSANPQPVVVYDRSSLAIVAANAAASTLCGRPAPHICGGGVDELVVPEQRRRFARALTSLPQGPTVVGGTWAHRRPDGDEVLIEVASSDVWFDGRAARMVVVTDVTERRRAEESLREWAAVVEASDDAILALALDGTVHAWNAGAERMYGYSAEEAIGGGLSRISVPGREDELRPILDRVATGERVEHYETLHCRRGGAAVPVSMTISPIRDSSEQVTAAAVIVRDVTERWELEAELRRQALRDALTGLPNRTLILDRLEQALERAGRAQRHVGVLFLDLDRFKTVNDSQGHSCGDELLVLVAARLAEAVRSDDTLARLGGDEFVVVCEGVESDGKTAEAVAARITSALEEPFVLSGTEIVITASIGIAVGTSGDTPEDLLRDADAAMYQAKEQGRARAEMFDEELRARADRRLALASALRRALTHGELGLQYQAVVSLADGRIVGAEALLRWEHRELGKLGPADFVPIAEETGLIIPIGRWVIEEATQRLAAWSRLLPGLTMSVNVSPRQLALGDFFDTVVACFESADVDPASLVLEITEGVLMDDVTASLAALAGLRNAGATLAVDDFGTGYSSLSYLKRLPLDVLKLDRAFVKGLPADPHDSAIVSAVVALSRTFGLTVVAEGIESGEQASALLALGCAGGQGYHFARPVSAEAFEEMLVRQADHGLGLPWYGHASQREPIVGGSEEIPRPRRGTGLLRGLRYRNCPRCGNRGVYLVPGRPILRCKYCAVFAMLSMSERALAEVNPDPFVTRLRSEREG